MSCENLSIPKPLTIQSPTTIFGIPYQAAGRTVANTTYPISAIVLHCYDGTISELVNEMKCRTRSSVISGSTENSFHYGIGAPAGSGGFQQFVEDNCISWTFGTYKNNTYATVPPPNIAINWPVLQAQHGINTTPDVYTIDIALAMGQITPASDLSGCYECPTASGLQQNQHDMLVQMLAYLAQEYSIPIDQDHMQFHDLIHCGEGEECPCKDIATLLTEVTEYCPPCEQEAVVAPIAETNDVIEYIYGITEACCSTSPGCAVKIPWNGCVIGEMAEDGDLTSYILGLSQNQAGQWCLTRGCLAVMTPLIGCGTVDDPLRLDRCGFDDWIDTFAPLSQIDRLMGIDDNGCLTLESPDSFQDRILCNQPENDQSVVEWVLAKTDNTCPEWVTLAQIQPDPITVDDTDCIDLDLTNNVITANPIIAPTQQGVDNDLSCIVGEGLFVPELTFIDTTTINFTIGGPFGDEVSAEAIISPDQGNVLVDSNGLFVPTPGATTINGSDCINVVDNGGGDFTISPIIDPAGDNLLTCTVNGLYVPTAGLISFTDTDCIDVTDNGGGNYSIDPILAPTQAGAENDLLCLPAGLFVPRHDILTSFTFRPILSGAYNQVISGEVLISDDPNNLITIDFTPVTGGIQVLFSVDDTDCIALDFTGNVLTATPIVDPAGDNLLTCGANGLYVPDSFSLNVIDTDCINLTLVGSDLSADIILAPTQGAIQNGIQCIPGQGLYAALYPDLTVIDDNCLDLTYTQSTGELTVSIILDPDPDNQLTCGPNGLLMSTPAGITVDDTDCLNLNLTAGGVLSGDIVLAGSQAGVPNIVTCIPGQGLYVPQGASLTASDTNCIDLSISPANVITADIVVAPDGPVCDNILSCTANGLYVPQTRFEVDSINLAGGNVIGVDTDCDDVNDFTWCEGFCEVVSTDDCAGGVLFTDGGVGPDYMLREFSLAGTTLTLNSAPEHVSESIPFNTATSTFVPAPTAPPGTLIPGTPTVVPYQNTTCRDMVVDIVFPGYGGDISVTSLGGATTFSYAIQYEVFINGAAVSIINPLGTDLLVTRNNTSMNASETIEIDGSTVGFTHTVTLAPGAILTVDLRPRIDVGLTPVNVDLPNSRVQIDEARLLISARTTA